MSRFLAIFELDYDIVEIRHEALRVDFELNGYPTFYIADYVLRYRNNMYGVVEIKTQAEVDSVEIRPRIALLRKIFETAGVPYLIKTEQHIDRVIQKNVALLQPHMYKHLSFQEINLINLALGQAKQIRFEELAKIIGQSKTFTAISQGMIHADIHSQVIGKNTLLWRDE